MQKVKIFMRKYHVFLGTKKDLFEILLTYPSRNGTR